MTLRSLGTKILSENHPHLTKMKKEAVQDGFNAAHKNSSTLRGPFFMLKFETRGKLAKLENSKGIKERLTPLSQKISFKSGVITKFIRSGISFVVLRQRQTRHTNIVFQHCRTKNFRAWWYNGIVRDKDALSITLPSTKCNAGWIPQAVFFG